MKKKLVPAVAFSLLAVGLAGCGDGNNNSSSSAAITPPATPAPEDQFGKQFGVLYRTAANTDPANVNDGDVIALTLTADPLPIT